MELTELQQKILKTIARFDVLDRPLTLLELMNYLDYPTTTEKLLKEISQKPLKNYIEEKQGWYFLSGRSDLTKIKNEHYRIASKKIKIAQTAAKILKNFPWIRGIAIYSSLALKNCHDESDIDLFFITAPNRVWSARFFINLILKLLRLRPSETKTKNKLCPSYFADENHLDLSIVNYSNDYYYYYFGPASFIFLYSSQKIKEKFYKANQWINTIFPNYKQPELSIIYDENKIKYILEKILTPFINEKFLRQWQLKILPTKYLKSCDGKKVILNESIIKLHDNDKRNNYNLLFEDKIEKILNAKTNY